MNANVRKPTVGIAGARKARPRVGRKQRRLPSGKDHKRLEDLISIGPAMVRDFEMLGIRNLAHLAKQEPKRLYERLGRLMGQRQDPCVLDTFCAAVAQARNPRLPGEKCQWWYWSRLRKAGKRNPKMEARNLR